MTQLNRDKNRRVLVIDDNRSIHDDFRKILSPATATAAAAAATERAVFGGAKDTVEQTQFEVDSAYQGQEGVLLAQKALQAGVPYAMAFVDVRMPPGWDGVETTRKLWELDPNLQVVLCTAYSDYSWGEMFEKLGGRDGLLILKKPFDAVEALQLAQALTEKWWLHQQIQRRMEELETRVAERTRELQESNRALQTKVAQHQRAEETLRESEQQLRVQTTALDAAANAILITDHNGLIQSVNPAFTALTGYTAQEAVGQNPRMLKSGQQDEASYRNLWQTISSGQVWCGEMTNRRKDGSLYTEEMTITPLRNGNGVIARYIAIKQDISDRKQAEEVLRQSEEQFRAMFDLASVGIAQADPRTGQWVRVNRKMCEITGYSAGELLQMRVADITHPEDRLSDRESFERVVRGEAPDYRMEKRYIRKDGALAWVNVNMTVIRDAAGQPTRTMAAIEDISERKRAEEELRWKTAFLEAQVNSSIDGILVVDQNRKMSLQNQRFVDFFKMPQHLAEAGAEENRLRWVTDMVKNPQQFLERVLHLYAHPNEISHDEVELKDGTILDRYTSPAIGKDGKYYGRIWTYRDMTERARDEEALRKIKLRLAHAMSLAQLVAWEYDVASGLFTFSDSYYALHDTTAKLENGNQMSAEVFVRKFVHPDDAHLVADEIGKAVATSDPGFCSQHEARIFRRDGEIRHVLVNFAITKDAAGRTIQIQGANQDITERKQLEAHLFQSQKMETVGKLAGGVAHEFNSIMTAILGQCELMLYDLPEGNPLRKNAIQIHQAADRAAALTRQLLAYGRKQILQPDVLDLNTVLAGMENTLRHLAGRDVDVRIAPSPGPKLVKADPGQIEQVIVNIVMNAADAMPHGGKLTLETGETFLDQEYVSQFHDLKAGEYVMLAITDTGAGMSQAVKARLFEPFFTTKGVGQGTGLGLATCHGIIKQSEGHISVYSEPGRGATFKIYLPKAQLDKKAPAPPLQSPGLARGTETILLVEDDPALREMAAELLGRLGYTVLTASDGLEALNVTNQAATGHIDLLFTDVVMPHMSGKELADRVRALYPRTKILFTSAYTENAIVHQGVLNPGILLLQKPFTPSALAHKVREVLDQLKTPEN